MSEEKKEVVAEAQTVKRGRGRPKGSKNKAKVDQVATAPAAVQA